MSGIYGYFQLNKASQHDLKAAYEQLSLRNHCYGSVGEMTSDLADLVNTPDIANTSGTANSSGTAVHAALQNASWFMGSRIEHLTDAYPAGRPILRKDSLCAVLDVVLYNREELLEKLSGTVTNKLSDEDLLFSWILQKGYDALSMVNGDFAGAIYDTEKQELTLFRNHLGIRPLYYYQDEECFIFSTDLRGLTKIPGLDMSINESQLYKELAGYNTCSVDETDFARIHCIHPACYEVLQPQSARLESHPYWKLGSRKIRFSSDAEYRKELRDLITDSVRRRLDAVSGKVGCELSGGLDSSVISTLVKRLGREACYYSWSYRPEEHPITQEADERNIIMDICKQEGIECEFARGINDENYVYPSDLLEKELLPFSNTLPISEGSARMKSQGAKAIFTGHGGDEGVSHRGNAYELWYHKEYRTFWEIKWHELKPYGLPFLRTLKHFFTDPVQMKERWEKPFASVIEIQEFLNPAFNAEMKKKPQEKLTFAYDVISYINGGGSRNRLDNVAVYGAQNGVRYMVPFLDYRVVDYAVSIPRRQYIRAGENRYIYRMAFDDLLPESLKKNARKATVSQESYKSQITDGNEKTYQSWKQLEAFLDWDFWKKYLDIEKIRYVAPKNKDDLDRLRDSDWLTTKLIYCACIQNIMAGARYTPPTRDL